MASFSKFGADWAGDVSTWELGAARWKDDGSLEESGSGGHDMMLISPWFTLEKGWEYSFRVEADVSSAGGEEAGYCASIHQKRWFSQNLATAVIGQEVTGSGRLSLLFNHKPHKTGAYRLAFSNHRPGSGVTKARNIRVDVFRFDRRKGIALKPVDTNLPNWGPAKRLIHSMCKNSRMFNAFVAGMEMRMGREESLSLPMFVGLCPTGQCNALCAFCSVTGDRSGIVKKQLPFDRVERFLSPTAPTVFMFGLEGNGEPTLYDHFDDLVETLTAGGSTFYLITNGERLSPEQIDLLLAARMNAVNFSLNAATAKTHYEVMKLKKFEVVVENIKRLVSLRGQNVNPTVSASFVVTNDNIHETVDFLRFAEFELKVDCIYIRPLSELAREFGPNEDFRSLVPYASDIRDMLDRVSDYLADVPRREYRVGSNLMRTQINVDPSAFKAMRHDPVDRVVTVKGFENWLLPPGRNGWISNDGSVSSGWNLNTMKLSFSNGAGREAVIESARIPVEAGKPLSLKFDARAEGSPVKIAVNGANGRIASAVIDADGQTRSHELPFNTGENERVWLTISGTAGSADFNFGRVRTHGEGIKREIKLPHSRKWEKQMKGSVITWSGSKVRIQWDGAQGLYLFKSYTVPCWPNQPISWPVTLEVKSGRLGVGVLSEDFQRWTHQFLFDVGRTQTELNFNTGDNRRLQVVLYSTKPEPLDAEVDWGGLLEEPPLMAPAESEPAAAPASVDDSEEKETGGVESSSSTTTPVPAATPKREAIKYYCQKPWTDLNNLTVDGRMDVCCIATGGTQQMYALGNIFTQEFQEIWNGPVMRNFRRTVNETDKLPPCQRCPMAYSYQGMFFDPSHTAWTIFLKIRAIRWIGRRYKKITNFERWIIKRLFKGFRVNPDGIPN